eukprot:CAMPEP_0183367388 /NCGR_PEP_ID=MMETSP0164_2-20130417/92295_1 /TAXON_ID=221442 /ORGANISM="Coccolithus pelagicus ssp braarudi, Strain PLY182g" /LENGTH=108 /DNA_ID=CAMNT_0025543313 /DNA_START=144 /DNA_END=468 /DNA_ORIENTATION=+
MLIQKLEGAYAPGWPPRSPTPASQHTQRTSISLADELRLCQPSQRRCQDAQVASTSGLPRPGLGLGLANAKAQAQAQGLFRLRQPRARMPAPSDRARGSLRASPSAPP